MSSVGSTGGAARGGVFATPGRGSYPGDGSDDEVQATSLPSVLFPSPSQARSTPFGATPSTPGKPRSAAGAVSPASTGVPGYRTPVQPSGAAAAGASTDAEGLGSAGVASPSTAATGPGAVSDSVFAGPGHDDESQRAPYLPPMSFLGSDGRAQSHLHLGSGLIGPSGSDALFAASMLAAAKVDAPPDSGMYASPVRLRAPSTRYYGFGTSAAFASEAWLSLLFWTVLSEFWRTMNYANVASHAFHPWNALAFCMVLGPIAVFRVPAVRRWPRAAFHFLQPGVVLCILAYWTRVKQVQVLALALATSLSWTWILAVTMLRPLVHSAASVEDAPGLHNTRTWYSVMTGLLLQLWLRFACFSVNPIWLYPGCLAAASALAATAILTLLLEAFADKEAVLYLEDTETYAVSTTEDTVVEDAATKAANTLIRQYRDVLSRTPLQDKRRPRWFTTSLSLGAVLFLTHWLYTVHNVVPRWAGLDPVLGLFVVAALHAGVALMQTSILSSAFAWILAVVLALVMALTTGLPVLLAGIMLALYLPRIWFCVMQQMLVMAAQEALQQPRIPLADAAPTLHASYGNEDKEPLLLSGGTTSGVYQSPGSAGDQTHLHDYYPHRDAHHADISDAALHLLGGGGGGGSASLHGNGYRNGHVGDDDDARGSVRDAGQEYRVAQSAASEHHHHHHLQQQQQPQQVDSWLSAVVLAMLVYLALQLACIDAVAYAYMPGSTVFHIHGSLKVILLAIVLSGASVFSPAWLHRPSLRLTYPPPYLTRLLVIVFLSMLISCTLVRHVGTTSPVDPPPSPDQLPKLSIMTWNVNQGYSNGPDAFVDLPGDGGLYNLAALVTAINDSRADIIGLQESDGVRSWTGNIDIVEWIAEALGFYSYYGPGSQHGAWGTALLSRYPLSNCATHLLPSALEQAQAIACDIRVAINGTTEVGAHPLPRRVRVYSAQLSTHDPSSYAQMHALATLMHDCAHPALLAGDLNLRPFTQGYNILAGTLDLLDVYYAVHRMHRATDSRQGATIDYVFGKRVHALNAVVLAYAEGISDHLPVLTNVQLHPPRQAELELEDVSLPAVVTD